MTMIISSKDPDNIEPYFFVWCDLKTGLNDGSVNDHGQLQGAVIASYTLTVETGITKDSDNKSAVIIKDPQNGLITYAANTVVSVWLSGGMEDNDYSVACKIVTNESPARTLEMTMIVPVRQN